MKENKKDSLVSRADLHIHSRYSRDAFSSPEEILKVAQKKKLDIIALTDHNTIEGALEAKSIADRFGVEVVIGEEIDTKEGDLLALFIEKLIEPGQTVLKTIKEIKRQGGLSIAPHPNNWLLGGISTENLLNIYKELDGIELINGSWPGKIGQEESRKMNQSVFELAVTGGSDAHLASQVGSSYTFFSGHSGKDLFQALKEKTTWPGGGRWSWPNRLRWAIKAPLTLKRQPLMPLALLKIIFKRISRN
jgi:predicted metal-dependent phosphoesterase TrpH